MKKIAILLLFCAVSVYGSCKDELDDLEQEAENGDIDSEGKHSQKRMWMPGTLWCGMGNWAKNDDDLGRYADVDACCREHDKCDKNIAAFGNKYGYQNWRLATISDCKCDKKFYNCLKNADEHKKAAKIVGITYFNVLGMPCLKFSKSGKATKGSSPRY